MAPPATRGRRAAFNELYLSDELKAFSYEGLYELIEGRRTEPKEGSYTSYLFEKGMDKILKKSARRLQKSSLRAASRTGRRPFSRSPTSPIT